MRQLRTSVLMVVALVPAAMQVACERPPALAATPPVPAARAGDASLDRRVAAFLEAERGRWSDWNVPYGDGKILYDLAVARSSRRILDIGTSTGHSAIWLAWAASKTGGRVITLEIDRGRHQQALANFERAGVTKYIDARLGDAHQIVKQLPGPFDLVFSDADKEWYLQYFLDLDAKVAAGGCFTAHNVLRPQAPQVTEFLARVKAHPDYTTRIERGGSSEGVSVSCKRPR
jgi:predicted O-methyltransferase YrrM